MRLILIVESSAFLLPPYSEPRRNASRHRTPSSPMYLSEVILKPFALSRVFLLSSGGKSIVLVKKKHLHVVEFFYLRT